MYFPNQEVLLRANEQSSHLSELSGVGIMKAKIKRLDCSGALNDQEDPARVARGLAYGIGIGVLLWVLAAAPLFWLI